MYFTGTSRWITQCGSNVFNEATTLHYDHSGESSGFALLVLVSLQRHNLWQLQQIELTCGKRGNGTLVVDTCIFVMPVFVLNTLSVQLCSGFGPSLPLFGWCLGNRLQEWFAAACPHPGSHFLVHLRSASTCQKREPIWWDFRFNTIIHRTQSCGVNVERPHEISLLEFHEKLINLDVL